MKHIKGFIDRLNDLQATNKKDFTMSMHEARLLHTDITKLLLDSKQAVTTTDQALDIEIKGGDF